MKILYITDINHKEKEMNNNWNKSKMNELKYEKGSRLEPIAK